MKKTTEQQITALFVQAMRTALALIDDKEKPTTRKSRYVMPESGVRGVYPHQSKYNPWRAYIWNTETREQVYLGAFPSINKAKAAQAAFRKGQPTTSGTKAALPTPLTETGIAQAIVAAGGQIALAEALGVSQQAVSSWSTAGYVPLARAREIEQLFGTPRAQLINPRIAAVVKAA